MLVCTFDFTVLLTAFIQITGLFFGGTNSAREKGRPGDNILGEAEYYFLHFLEEYYVLIAKNERRWFYFCLSFYPCFLFEIAGKTVYLKTGQCEM